MLSLGTLLSTALSQQYGQSPLLAAIEGGHSKTSKQLLIKSAVDVNTSDKVGIS